MKMPRIALACITASMSLTVLPTGVAGAASTDPPSGRQPGASMSPLAWTSCGDGYQCAPARVPLDYGTATGEELTLDLRRWPAAAPAERIGTLFVYADGPGRSGWDRVRSFAATSPPEIRDRFDIVGFDPRGVRRSGQVSCLDGPAYRGQWAQVSTGGGPEDLHTTVRLARQWNTACETNSGGMLPYVGAEAQARDLDVLRSAVGDEKLTFFGEGYATYVGTVYANLFPERTRALVLDAGYDPVKYARDPYTYDYAQYRATDTALHRFLDWCAATPERCAFAGAGQSADGLAVKVRTMLGALDAKPLRDSAGAVSVNGATMLSELTYRLNGGTRRWAALGTDLHRAESRTGPLMYTVTDADAAFTAANVAVECADRAYPGSSYDLKARLAQAAADFPLTAPGRVYGPPAVDQAHAAACTQWPAARRSRYTGSFEAVDSAPILVVGTTGDPDTPYEGSVALSRILRNGHLLTWEGEGHTARGRSTCAGGHLYAYLLRLTLPPHGTVCRDAPIQP
jgi:pimeloyl-ACP methyl ester carboxylesterase